MEQPNKYLSNRKLVKSGSLLEIYQFGRDIHLERRIRHIQKNYEKAAKTKRGNKEAVYKRSILFKRGIFFT